MKSSKIFQHFSKVILFLCFTLSVSLAFAGEADLVIPDLSSVSFLNIDGRALLVWGMSVCVFGFIFGFVQYAKIRQLPVHSSMRDISELIYVTCKTYLITQGKFILILEGLVGIIIVAYFGWLRHFAMGKVALILFCSLVGIAGSYFVAWFGMRINTLANSRCAFASLTGKPFPVFQIPLQAGMSIGMLLISVELFVMLAILLFIHPENAGACFIGFAIGESLGASVLRIAGGIFTKIADIGSDLMKIVFNIKEDDARNPGVIADCTGDNAGDSVGPTADGFETYGVTGVALITFIVLAVIPQFKSDFIIWIFTMRVLMILTSIGSYTLNSVITAARLKEKDKFNFEAPLTELVWLTSLISIGVLFAVSYLLLHANYGNLWLTLSIIISCGTLAAAVIPELTKVFTSCHSKHVQEIVNAGKEGGASLVILNFLNMF